ncbi:MAG: TfoX/Sxy family protein [Oscillospiraceae bacterium]|nr:TfoX/Sxy family protein [Oscillospiraceae bacterium]
MASSQEYLRFVLEQCPEGVTCRAMMGEYILYYRGKVFGGVYDNRFLVKPTKSAVALMPEASWEQPYAGAKQMLLVERIEDKEFLEILLKSMDPELPEKKKRSPKV